MYRYLSFPGKLLRHVHLRLTVILSSRALRTGSKKVTSRAVPRPRMVAELIVALRTKELLGTLEQQRHCYRMEELVQCFDHQLDQLICQQMVIDEAGAARTPVLQYAQEKKEEQFTS